MIVTPPNEFTTHVRLRPGPKIFLAGGITDCEDWQTNAIEMLRRTAHDASISEPHIFNPRRPNFPVDDPSAAEAQIKWEYDHLNLATVVMFWFAGGSSSQPIALYELARMISTNKGIAVGVDPAYVRADDVRIQLSLARPELVVHSDLRATVTTALLWAVMRA